MDRIGCKWGGRTAPANPGYTVFICPAFLSAASTFPADTVVLQGPVLRFGQAPQMEAGQDNDTHLLYLRHPGTRMPRQELYSLPIHLMSNQEFYLWLVGRENIGHTWVSAVVLNQGDFATPPPCTFGNI